MNIEYHLDFANCEKKADSETSSKSTDSSQREKSVSPQRGPIATRAEGIVEHYNEDRGYGFAVTADVARKQSNNEITAEEIFFHISDVDSTRVEEGDRLRFDVIRGEKGLKCDNISVVERARDRDLDTEIEEYQSTRRHGFGHQKDDTKYGHGVKTPNPGKIRSFRDERRFR
ncbi:cold-shock protein [Saliphagus sp. GCM10025334]